MPGSYPIILKQQQSRATGMADHMRSLDDLLSTSIYLFVPPPSPQASEAPYWPFHSPNQPLSLKSALSDPISAFSGLKSALLGLKSALLGPKLPSPSRLESALPSLQSALSGFKYALSSQEIKLFRPYISHLMPLIISADF